MLGDSSHSWIRWLCLGAFVLAGPLEGDEVAWGPFAHANIGGSALTATDADSPRADARLDLGPDGVDRTKDLTVDIGAPKPKRPQSLSQFHVLLATITSCDPSPVATNVATESLASATNIAAMALRTVVLLI